MTQFANRTFSVMAPGTDGYRRKHAETFGERPPKFCLRCDRLLAWCECPFSVTSTGPVPLTVEVRDAEEDTTPIEYPDPDDLEDYRRL